MMCVSTGDLRVVLVSDTQGSDDEGMKKIARSLSVAFRDRLGVAASIQPASRRVDHLGSVDILHYVGGPTYRSVLYAAWVKRRVSGIRTILTFANPRWGSIADVTLRLFPPDCVIVQAQCWQERMHRLGIHARLIAVSGVDLERFRPVSLEQRRQLRRELGLPSDKKLVLHIGHLKDDRNLEALHGVQLHSDTQVVIIGSTTTRQSEQLVSRLERSGCIVLRSYQSRIEQFYQAASCYVFPTVDPGASIQIPLRVLEAMATNLPVVTTQFGGLPDHFPSGKGLYYVSSDQLGGLPRVLKLAISTTSETRALVGGFSWSDVAGRLCRVYTELLGG